MSRLYIARVYFTYNNGKGRRSAQRTYASLCDGELGEEFYDVLRGRVCAEFNHVTVNEISTTLTDGTVEL